MRRKPLFAGLVFDEDGKPVETAYIGDEPFYVVDDAGFRRHVPSEQVDRFVLRELFSMMEGHEDLLAEQAVKMLGQDDPFSKAALEVQLKNLDQHIDEVLMVGIPEEHVAYLGMMGFRIRINHHGEVVEINWPGAEPGDDDF